MEAFFDAVIRDDVADVQQLLRNGVDVNAVRSESTPLMNACEYGCDQTIRILLDAGADARWRNRYGNSAISRACRAGILSTVQLLIDHDNGLLEMAGSTGLTPLFYAIRQQHSDIVRFLLDSGANPHHADRFGETALMTACDGRSLEDVRLLLDAGVDVEARDSRDDRQQTALHYAAKSGNFEVVRELILQHNANMFALDAGGHTPFDMACIPLSSDASVDYFLDRYGNKLTQDHGQLVLHELLKVAEYSFSEDEWFHPPLNPSFRIILPLGELTLTHLRTLLRNLDPELIRGREHWKVAHSYCLPDKRSSRCSGLDFGA